jgi:hypothetical protein
VFFLVSLIGKRFIPNEFEVIIIVEYTIVSSERGNVSRTEKTE